jgi:hypothetical protein
MAKNTRTQLDRVNSFLNIVNKEIVGFNKGIVQLYVFIQNYTVSKKLYLNLDLYGSQCEIKYIELEKYRGSKVRNLFITTRCNMIFDYSRSGLIEG